jgi:hypothetical protein
MELAKKLGAGDVGFQRHSPISLVLNTKIGIHRTLAYKPRGPIPEDQG